jgi:zinc transporter ZupT
LLGVALFGMLPELSVDAGWFVALAVTLHKIPEGPALGGIVRGAMHSGGRSRTRALASCILTEGCIIVAAEIRLALAPRLGGILLDHNEVVNRIERLSPP